MIVKYDDEKEKFVLWCGFSHKQLTDEEFDTIEQARIALNKLAKEKPEDDLLVFDLINGAKR